MLFDLRGKGRRRTVRVIYASLAILMGGGLVFFGIGGDVSGGLLNAFDGSGGQNVDETFKKRVEGFEKRVKANPKDATAWAELARARFQEANPDVDQTTGEFTEAGIAKLRKSEEAWSKYLALKPANPDTDVALIMVRVFEILNEPDKAVIAQELVVDETDPPTADAYKRYAALAYLAGQTRKGDLAAKRAVELSDKDQKKIVKDQLEQYKQQAASAAIQEATQGAAPGAVTTP